MKLPQYSFFVLSMLLLLSSCTSKPQVATTGEEETNEMTVFRTIHFTNPPKRDKEPLLLSDLAEEVEYVKLETLDQCLIGEIGGCRVTDEDIFIQPFRRPPYRFSRKDGKYICTIGAIGQGPQEMLLPQNITATNKFVYAWDHHTICIYDVDGNFVRKLPLKFAPMYPSLTIINDEQILFYPGEDGNFMVGDPNLKRSDQYGVGYVIDLEGNELASKFVRIKDADPKSDYSLCQATPYPWYYHGDANFWDPVTDTVYTYTKGEFVPRYYFDFGKEKFPVVREKLLPEHSKYLHFSQCVRETKDYLYLHWAQNQKAYLARYNKRTESLMVCEQKPTRGKFWNFLEIPGITNDLDGCSYFNYYLTDINQKGDMAIIITPGKVDKIRKIVQNSGEVKFPEKRRQLLKLLDEMGEEDNPIIAIYKLKE